MLIIASILLVISALGGLAVCYLGVTLSWLFIQGIPRTLDWVAAGVVTVLSLLYLAHPVLAFFLIKQNLLAWSILCDMVFIVVSAIACFILIMGISTAARP